MSAEGGPRGGGIGAAINGIVRVFLDSNLSIVLVVLATATGVAALLATPREEDPQIVVPVADVIVDFPGHDAETVERLVVTPLERLLFELDGVENVYGQAMRDRGVVTVRFDVGEDRERSLVRVGKRIDEHVDAVPAGVTGWTIRPREIDDVPIVTLTLVARDGDDHAARRVAEELVARLAADRDVSRTAILGGRPRVVRALLDPERLAAHDLAALEVKRAIERTNRDATAGEFAQRDERIEVAVGGAVADADALAALVVGVHNRRPVRLADVADVVDAPDEVESLVRHAWGPARGVSGAEPGAVGDVLGDGDGDRADGGARPAVTITVAKKRGTNAVRVADRVIAEAERLVPAIVPDGMELVVTRNDGRRADAKVDELVEALGVAIVIVIALLTLGLGWREAIVVAVAVPVVFGLTLLVNLLAGYTINRVTLFALILSLGLIVDDPIVDVENIARLFAVRGRATREIVLEAVAEIRPPLITATLAVIVSFVPLRFITGMMGPYMAPMALNVPVAMLMSMLVAFTITPWLAYHLLRRRRGGRGDGGPARDTDDIEAARGSRLDRLFRPLLGALLARRRRAWLFLGGVLLATIAAGSLAALRLVPLKMLPFDNRDELLLVLDHDRGTTLERTDALVRELEARLATVPEVAATTSYVGLPSPIDFNGLVRRYDHRVGPNLAEIRVHLAPKRRRTQQSHAIGLRLRDELTAIADRHGGRLKIVEIPPGPPVLSTIVAEVYGAEDRGYDEMIAAAGIVRHRLALEPGVVDVDDSIDAAAPRLVFDVDRAKAAVTGVAVEDVAATVRLALAGADAGRIRAPRERVPLSIVLRLSEPERSSLVDLERLRVRAASGALVPLAEIGRWRRARTDQVIHHKNLHRVVWITAEVAGRTPPEVVADVLADRVEGATAPPPGAAVPDTAGRTFLAPGGGVPWGVGPDFAVDFAGEGEWKITLEVFRDLGLAFAAALVGIYILLAAQTGSFVLPVVIMLAIPLTIVGIMPGFLVLNLLGGGAPGGHDDPVLFTATAMIGMIALAGIVTRQSTILVDFVQLARRRGRDLREALIAGCVVRLRPILLTAGTAMLSAAPIVIDPVFSGLAWALVFGLGAATAFTVLVVPVAYWLLAEATERRSDESATGLPSSGD